MAKESLPNRMRRFLQEDLCQRVLHLKGRRDRHEALKALQWVSDSY